MYNVHCYNINTRKALVDLLQEVHFSTYCYLQPKSHRKVTQTTFTEFVSHRKLLVLYLRDSFGAKVAD